MSNRNTSSGSSGGIGCLGVLTIVFVVLKITNLIDWSWWWVLAPAWIPVSLVLVVLLVIVLVLLVKWLTSRAADWRVRRAIQAKRNKPANR